MSKRLEDFVKDNRDAFDKFEPGPVVWNNIQQELRKSGKKEHVVISIKVVRLAAAAVLLLAIAGTAFLLLNKKNAVTQPDLAQNSKPAAPIQNRPANDTNGQAQPDISFHEEDPKAVQAVAAEDDEKEYREELYHYTKLVELKQNEIEKIKDDEPMLYRHFAGDFNRLDSTFHILKKELPVNPNREQILEAMIQNLRYQEELLNQQLNIIKKINQSKKQAYEKALRTA